MLLIPILGISQESAERSWKLKGYLDDMQMVQFPAVEDPWTFDNEIHNRFDFTWNPAKVFGMGVGLRTRFVFGQSLTANPAYKGVLFNDNGLVNMTWDLWSSASAALLTQFDRAWISGTLGKFQITAGRQRINWGQTLVWNPNDLFNTYSYFDVDYPERPGSDAIRLQVYPSATSVLELAAKLNSKGKLTCAALGRFNTGGFDVQFLAGLVDDQDYVVGAGWSGNISGAAFRGEVNYYQPKNNWNDTSGVLLATIGADYTFSNSLALTFQVLYNQLPAGYRPESMVNVYQAPSTPKLLSFAEWNIFLMGSYPVTPLFDVSLATMYFPDLAGYFVGPTLNYNVRQNIDLSLFIQYFNGRFKSPDPLMENVYFKSFLGTFRVKWSF
ncbi:MAG: hypothetical protein PHP04_11570 [Bacteroidales bacterium]|nr:hypothetical protein [Bacteroidales bacterium]HNW74304.1 hypothetical protein [Bacteroidales bacterium]HPS51450.1 hypothetical protein [Bacteroidales bacterium]